MWKAMNDATVESEARLYPLTDRHIVMTKPSWFSAAVVLSRPHVDKYLMPSFDL